MLPPIDDTVPLPSFIVLQPDGIYVTLPQLSTPALFFSFIDRIFSTGLRFVDLDYSRMQKLLYEWGPTEIAKLVQDFKNAGKSPMLQLAAGIVPFPEHRQQCYRNARLIENGAEAEYVFEPIMIERAIEEAVYDDSGAEGEPPVASYLQKMVMERAKLDIDEFIAAMWLQNVRYAIDVATVKKALARNASERLVIARRLEPTAGTDASLVELTDSLHRNNAPKVLPDQRVDLRQYQNRFPQMEKNTKLVKKVPAILGKPGRDIAGYELVPEPPHDFDIATLAGPGTKIERMADGEEFVSTEMGGFLNIDSVSQSFSIAEKIINREGVSLRTTGNLSLSGDEYEEHGEVQEHAQIEGNNMTFMSDVFGHIVSNGGRVLLKENLAAGSIRSPDGAITIKGKASRSLIEAVGGDIVLHYAESCRIIGKNVNIEKAIHCDILAQDLTVQSSEGCALAAQKIQVGSTAARHDVETAISILIPDMSAFATQLNALAVQQAEFANAVQLKRKEIETITSQQEMKTYLVLSTKLRSNTLNMNAEQTENWQKLSLRVTPTLQRLKILNDELRAASGAVEKTAKEIQDVKHESARFSAEISCSVAKIAGETVIRTLRLYPDQAPLETLPQRELHRRLRDLGAGNTVLFNGSSGKFNWEHSEPGESDD
ncbi:MAG: flagellar assembly protein A [Burkholderiales bacterium]